MYILIEPARKASNSFSPTPPQTFDFLQKFCSFYPLQVQITRQMLPTVAALVVIFPTF